MGCAAGASGIGASRAALILAAADRCIASSASTRTAELALFVVLLGVVAVLRQTRPGRDRLAMAATVPPAGRAERSTEADAVVVGQQPGGLLISGRMQNGVRPDSRHVLWETLSTEEDAHALLVERDLATRWSTTLARDVAPEYGLAVTDR